MSHPDHAKPHEHEEVEKPKARPAHAEHVEAEKGPRDPSFRLRWLQFQREPRGVKQGGNAFCRTT